VNRRAFLQLLASGALGAAATASLDVERLLWVPRPIITVPGETFVSLEWVTAGLIRELEKNLRLVDLFNREYDQLAGVATTVNIRLPARYR
jgi:hypothetical protein